jgi:hypothetical protein
MPLFSATDLESARQRIRQNAWAAEIFAAVRARADHWIACPTNVLHAAGGWVHDFVCPEHWNALTFDPQSPHAHRCLLGETRASEKLDAAWRVLEHRRIANVARDLTLIYGLTGERVYAESAREILLQYALRYPSYAGATDARGWMLKGRVFNQALTEAIWTVPIAHAYDRVRDMLTPNQNARIINALLRPLAATLTNAQADLIAPQNNLKSNYNAWLIAALGVLGYALGDPDLVARQIKIFRAHLSAAILPDGFEYEGAPYYHNFVALAYTIFAEAARANNCDLYAERGAQGQSIEALWRAFATLAYADGSIPAINDGAYYLGAPFATEICETYEIALVRTREPEFAWLIQRHCADKRDTWSALIFAERDLANAPTPRRESVCLRDVGIAVLRDATNAIQVCMPFGAYAGSHSHLDRLAPQIFPFATDPGTPLYGVDARAQWFAQTAAHNAIVVDEKSQSQCAGELIEWRAERDSTTLRLALTDAGVKFSRVCVLSPRAFIDTVTCESDTEHTFDWILHLDGECHFDLVEWLPATGAYQFAQMIARAKSRGVSLEENPTRALVRAVIHHSGKIFSLALTADPASELVRATSPAHVATPRQSRQMVIVRTRARTAGFAAVYDWIE